MESLSATVQSRGRGIGLAPGLIALTVALGLGAVVYGYRARFDQWHLSYRLLVYGSILLLAAFGAGSLWRGLRGGRPGARPLLRVRNRWELPREGLSYIAIMMVLFVGSLLGHSNMLLLVFAMMVGPFVLNGSAIYSMLRGTRVVRKPPPRAMAGEPFSVEVVLVNRRRLVSAWLMIVTDEIRNVNERLRARVLYKRVPPRDSSSSHYQLQLLQRGRYYFGPIDLSTRFPLGLIERGLIIDAPAEILIYPKIGRLTPNWKREQIAATELVQQSRPRVGVYHDEYQRLREYRPGDNPRMIHWRTSARRNQLILREYQQSREQNLSLILDLWIPPRPSPDDEARVELGVSFAATICLEHLRFCRDSELAVSLAGAEAHVWRGQSSPAGLESLLDMLALVQPGRKVDVTRVLEETLAAARPDTRFVLVTTRRLAGGGESPRAPEIELPPDAAGRVQLFEADPVRLATYFTTD